MVIPGACVVSGSMVRRSRIASYRASPKVVIRSWSMFVSLVAAGAGSQFDTDVAQFGVEIERMHAALAADARVPGAAEGSAQVAQEPAVDPGDADVDLFRHAVGARGILGPDGRAQAVLGVIRQRHCF